MSGLRVLTSRATPNIPLHFLPYLCQLKNLTFLQIDPPQAIWLPFEQHSTPSPLHCTPPIPSRQFGYCRSVCTPLSHAIARRSSLVSGFCSAGKRAPHALRRNYQHHLRLINNSGALNSLPKVILASSCFCISGLADDLLPWQRMERFLRPVVQRWLRSHYHQWHA